MLVPSSVESDCFACSTYSSSSTWNPTRSRPWRRRRRFSFEPHSPLSLFTVGVLRRLAGIWPERIRRTEAAQLQVTKNRCDYSFAAGHPAASAVSYLFQPVAATQASVLPPPILGRSLTRRPAPNAFVRHVSWRHRWQWPAGTHAPVRAWPSRQARNRATLEATPCRGRVWPRCPFHRVYCPAAEPKRLAVAEEPFSRASG